MRLYNSDGSQNKSILPIVLLIIVAAVVLLNFEPPGKRAAIGGISDPVQKAANGSTVIHRDGYSVAVTYLYEYEIEALVLSTHKYPGYNVLDKLAPKDLALGWGPVAQYNTSIDFHWGQSGRFYFWHTDTMEEIAPVGYEAGVNTHSANCHIIAADTVTKRMIDKMKKGDHIKLKGYLVNIDANPNKPSDPTYYWRSSTTREDTGDGACELIYVTQAQIIK